ncbi:hypothetical protein NA209_23510, partial [Salmonella sp. NW858]|uniref:hypothetical protein n=1 Tax=Salmonella sp. NW858 TaxID=2948339 RepID=UPI003F438D9B
CYYNYYYYCSSRRCISRARFVAVALSAGDVEIAASRWKSLSSANIFAVGATHAVPFELAAWGFAHSTLCHLNRHHPNGYDEQHKQKKRTEWSANSLARHYRSPFFSYTPHASKF